MAKKHHEEEHENLERWLISYADMLTLMFAFFVMLFAISQIDLKKLREFSKGAAGTAGTSMDDVSPVFRDGGRGGFQSGKNPNIGFMDVTTQTIADVRKAVGMPKGTESTPRVSADGGGPDVGLSDKNGKCAAQAGCNGNGQEAGGAGGLAGTEQQIEQVLAQNGLQDKVRLELNSRGLVVTVLTDKVVFDLGKADLRADGEDILTVLGPILRDVPNDIVVEGHTDNLPLRGGGKYADNYDLSVARASSVLRYLIQVAKVPPDRVSAAGYADTRPVAENDSAEGRQKNRRVEIVLLARPAAAPAAEAPAAEAPAAEAPAPEAPAAEAPAGGGH